MGNKLNLVYIVNSLNVGGAQIGMERLLYGLDSSTFDITVIALDGRKRRSLVNVPEAVNVIKLYPSVFSQPSLFVDALCALSDADIVVGSMFHSSILAGLYSAVNEQVTVVIWQHSTVFKTQTRKQIYSQLGSHCDAILADSMSVKNMLEQETDLANIEVVPIAGINLDDYTQVSHKNKDTISIGTVGTLREAKNYPTVLAVAERLQNSPVEFHIAGDGDLYDDIQDEIDKNGLDNVHMHGFVDDVPKFLSKLDIYFQPSNFEGLCITVLEAMASGLPVVASNVGGIKHNVTHKTTGLLYSPSDVSGFVHAIRKLADDPDLRQSYGTNGRDVVLEQYTQDALVSNFLSVIQDYS